MKYRPAVSVLRSRRYAGALAGLMLAGIPLANAADESVVTWAADIKPLLESRCTSCHSG